MVARECTFPRLPKAKEQSNQGRKSRTCLFFSKSSERQTKGYVRLKNLFFCRTLQAISSGSVLQEGGRDDGGGARWVRVHACFQDVVPSV
jgi:hypothetical protein